MNTYKYQRSRSLFDLCPRSLLTFVQGHSELYFQIAARRIETKFHVQLLWVVRLKVCSDSSGCMTKMAAMPIYGKNLLIILFSETSWPITFELGIQHKGLGPLFK